MKRIILSVLAMSALLCGCQKDHVSELVQERGTIQATIEEISATRTVMDENNNIRWSEGDQIVGFMMSTLGVKYQVTAASVGKTSASFEEVSSGGLNAGTELEHIIAYYPYSSSVSAAKSGSNYTLDVILPTEQTYVAESFGNGAMPMVAVSETNNITFRNVCGGMKLQLKGTQKVVSIKVEGKNGELLSGTATVTAYTDETKPAITMASGASTSVTLDCVSGVQLNESTATEFILAMPPVLFSKGFTVTVADIDGEMQTIETDKANEVKRSTILVMPAVLLEDTPDVDINDGVLKLPEDPQSENTSFTHRMLLVEHTGNQCPHCPRLMDMLKELAGDESYASKYLLVASHSYNYDDAAYSSAASTLSRALNLPGYYPWLTFNLTTNEASYLSEIKAGIDDLHKDVADVGISAVSVITGNILKVKVQIKVAKENTYRIAAWLLEDNIYALQSGATASWQNTHNNALRAMAGESKTEQIYGLKVGTLQPGAKASMESEITLNESWDADNCKLLIIASSSDGLGDYDVANCIIAPIGESVKFEYN